MTDNPDKLIFLLGYLAMTSFFAFFITGLWSKRSQRPFNRIVLSLSIFGVILNTVWILSVFFPKTSLPSIMLSISAVLLPILWSAMSFGLILYGILSIIRRETLVRFSPDKITGLYAVYWGVVFTILGVMTLLIEIVFGSIALCPKYSLACTIFYSSDLVFGFLGSIIIFLKEHWLL
jgi:hypothetical protein